MVRLNANGNLRVWINEDPALNYRQTPLPSEKKSEKAMVEAILGLFSYLIPEL